MPFPSVSLPCSWPPLSFVLLATLLARFSLISCLLLPLLTIVVLPLHLSPMLLVVVLLHLVYSLLLLVPYLLMLVYKAGATAAVVAEAMQKCI